MNLKKLSGYHLKFIAVISMLIDHIAVIFQASLSESIYFILRAAGRLSFPLFCFLLVEGFFHTKNKKRYQQRLFIFAVLSELPYDLAFRYLPVDRPDFLAQLHHPLSVFSAAFQQQNVLFTLFLGFTAMLLMERKQPYGQYSIYKNIDTLILFCCLSEILQTDCGAAGILCIFLFYSSYKERENNTGLTIKESLIDIAPTVLLTYIPPFPVQISALADSLLLRLYNGEKGKNHKYFFYLFYPLHLVVLYLIK